MLCKSYLELTPKFGVVWMCVCVLICVSLCWLFSCWWLPTRSAHTNLIPASHSPDKELIGLQLTRGPKYPESMAGGLHILLNHRIAC